MVTFKSFNNIVIDMLQQLRLSQPSLDTKPGSVARDLMIDLQALQMSDIYEALKELSNLQSILNVSGQDLVNYASNFGVTKQNGTKAIGTVVFTFKSIDDDITIPSGTTVRTRNGIPFLTVSTLSITTAKTNSLRATATRLKQELATAGINDAFAIEASVEAQSQGSMGNVSAYAVTSAGTTDANNVVNLVAFTGGTDLESDNELRARVLSTFAGANVGTSVAYRSTILSLSSAIDALVAEPGSPLMIRDGTVVGYDSDGNLIVFEPGTGGRVDIYVLGTNAQSGTDSFVYNDQSGKDDPTDILNDYVLGQSSLTPDITLTINSRRVAALSQGDQLPEQPVSSIVSVSGSLSGPNFVEQYLDDVGNLQGNFKLVSDTGSAGGSPFGLDKLRWTDNKIELIGESNTKTGLNSVDGLGFTDVLEITGAEQDIQVVNENSTVSGSSRNYIQLKHSPVRTVSRVFNLTTGERYVISDQTPDDAGSTNTTGRVLISGRTLPTSSDTLQVDYTWIYSFDENVDFDNLNPIDILNEAQDSIEWGYSNYIRDELKTVSVDAYGNMCVTTDLPVSRVLSVNTFRSQSGLTVQSGKKVVASVNVSNIHSIKDTSLSGAPEVYNTLENDGSVSNKTITLPTDTLAGVGDLVNLIYNLNDVFTSDSYGSGTVLNNQITLPSDAGTISGTNVRVNYVANFSNLLPKTDVTGLPVSTDGLNSFQVIVDGYQPVQNEFSGSVVISNKRRSPTNLKVTAAGVSTSGLIRVVGTTINKVTGVYTATANDELDLAILIRRDKGLSDTASLGTLISVARIVSVESVTLTAAAEVSSVITAYDTTNYSLNSNVWDKAGAIQNTSLSKTEVGLSSVSVNTASPISTGTHLRVVFYYAQQFDFEDIFFSKNGVAITDKRFGHIYSISRISGFQDAQGNLKGSITIDSLNQPEVSSTYSTDYTYTAPKEGERITVNFEYNKLIVDATQAIESVRPITADVLVKAAVKVAIDVDAYIIVTSEYQDKEETVKQDVSDNISSKLNSEELGGTIDASDIVDSIYNVAGVDRVRITRFNRANVSGTKESITVEGNEYIAPGTIDVEIEER
jgi:uncharacterized phage protein gp47/JayE